MRTTIKRYENKASSVFFQLLQVSILRVVTIYTYDPSRIIILAVEEDEEAEKRLFVGTCYWQFDLFAGLIARLSATECKRS